MSWKLRLIFSALSSSVCFAYSEGIELITSDKISFQNSVIIGSSCLIRREFDAELEIVLGLEPLCEQLSRGSSSHSPKGAGPAWDPALKPGTGAGAVFSLPTARSGFNSLWFVVPGVLPRENLQLQPYITS